MKHTFSNADVLLTNHEVGRRCPQRAGARREKFQTLSPMAARGGEDTAPYHPQAALNKLDGRA
jgi:hypothetical protein